MGSCCSNTRDATHGQATRSLWHHDEMRRGIDLVQALPVADWYVEELRLQGLIAAEHATAKLASETDWPAIVDLYGQLEALTGSPVVRLNRAVAVAESEGPRAGLAVLTGLDNALAGNHRLHAVRADMARRAADRDLARSSYDAALALCTNQVERDYLGSQRSALDSSCS